MIYERFEENPHLAAFYEHLKQHGLAYNPHSYPCQLKFLQGRINQETEIFGSQQKNSSKQFYIVDRSIFEDASVFAKSQNKSGLMSNPEYSKYQNYLQSNLENIRIPDLLIYLKMEPKKLYERIQKRGREMEKEVSEEYLRSLQGLYESFIEEIKTMGTQVVEIQTDNMDDYPNVLEAISKLKK